MKLYNTKQRDTILSFFEKNKDKCFSAREILESGEVDVGPATLYRALAVLTRENKLRRFNSESKKDGAYYMLACMRESESHIHLICEICGRMIHADCGFVNSIAEHFLKSHSFKLNSAKTTIYGICKECLEDEKQADPDKNI